jgi:hypothetical protein
VNAFQPSTSSRSFAADLLTRWAAFELFQKSGAAICFSSSASWDSFPTKSKTLQKLGDGVLGGGQTVN